MASLTKTFSFASNAEGWTHSGSASAAAYLGTDGNPSGCLYAEVTGRNTSGSGSWSWTGTFEDMGIASGSTITGYSAASFDHKCAVWVVGGSPNDLSLTINDGTARTLVSAVSFTGATSWANASASPSVSGLSLASNTSVTLSVPYNLDNNNDKSAEVELRVDTVSITVEYNEALSPVTGSLSATESGSDTATSSGSVSWPPITGTVSATESGADTVTASGVVPVTGSMSATGDGTDTASASGQVLIVGSTSVQEVGADTMSASGGGELQPVTGSMSVTESGADSLESLGQLLVSGLLSVQETGLDTAAILGGVEVQGAASIVLADNDIVEASGQVVVSGTMDATDEQDTFFATQAAVTVGTMDAAETEDDTAEASGVLVTVATTKGGGSYQPARKSSKRKPVKHLVHTVESEADAQRELERILSDPEPQREDPQPPDSAKSVTPQPRPRATQPVDLSPVYAAVQDAVAEAGRDARTRARAEAESRLVAAQELAANQAEERQLVEAMIAARMRDEDEAAALIFIMANA